MAEVTSPILTDDTFADKMDDLIAAVQPQASGVGVSTANMHYITEDDAQGALAELDAECYSLSNSLTNYIKVVEKNIGNITMSANASGYLSVSVNNETGYTPIGIVGYTANGTASSAIQEFRVSNGKAYIYLMNLTSASKTVSNITLSILYIKNMS